MVSVPDCGIVDQVWVGMAVPQHVKLLEVVTDG